MVRQEPVHPAGTTKNGPSRAGGAMGIAGVGTRQRKRLETQFAALVPLVALLCALVVSPMAGHASGSAQSLPAVLVEWESGESIERLSSSSYKTDFFPLSNHFISQDNSIFCGPVSSAIVLNALRLGKKDGLPKDRQSIAEDEMAWLWEGADPFYGKYTPNNVLNEETKTRLEVLGKPILIEGEAMSDFGLQLSQLAQALRSHGLKVETRVVDDDADADAIRREIAANLASGDDYVLVNYARRALGQEGGGHISPLGAYDEHSDSFLIMDVNPNRAPWVWVSSDDLIAAMRTFDTVENRGYLLISDME
ncbi:MAG: phytochelatin synthase [bacterium]|nr:phytochelatin synthase [bacterium]